MYMLIDKTHNIIAEFESIDDFRRYMLTALDNYPDKVFDEVTIDAMILYSEEREYLQQKIANCTRIKALQFYLKPNLQIAES